MRLALSSALIALALAGAAAAQPSPEASQAQDLSNCAGAVAAIGNLDVVTYRDGQGGTWGEVLGRILARLNVEPGVEGMTGRYAASAARSYWNEQPRANQQAEAERCRARFGS